MAGGASKIAMLKEPQGVPWLQLLALAHFWTDDEGKQGGTPPFPPLVDDPPR